MFIVRAIVPEDDVVPDPALLVETVMRTLDEVSSEVQTDFEKTSSNWNDPPQFVIEPYSQYQRNIFTEHNIYGLVNDGARPHEILPVAAAALRFQLGYKARTSPGVLESGESAYSGVTTIRKSVYHPGFMPRGFDAAIKVKYDEILPDKMQVALDKIL